MKFGHAAESTPSGPVLGPTQSYFPTAPSSTPARPFEAIGKSAISLFGTPGRGATLTPEQISGAPTPLVQGEAFKGVPILEQASQLVGGVANIPAFALSIPDRLTAAKAWEQNAGPERAKWEALVSNNSLSQADAEARFRRSLYDQQHGQERDLFADLRRPSTDYSLGGQVFGGLGSVFSLVQRPWERATGGNVGALPGALARGDFRSPLDQRLDSFVNATDAELNYGQGDYGHPELIAIRDALKRGEISREEAFDQLIVSGFGVSNPTGAVGSIFNMVTSDPTNLLAVGGGILAKAGTKAAQIGARALVTEIGAEEVGSFAKQLAAKGIQLTDENLIAHALKDSTMRPLVEQSLKGANKMTRWMILDAPAVMRVGTAIQRVLDPFSFFGADGVGKQTERKFATKLASGVINGYGASNYRSLVAHASTILGDDMAEVLQDGFDRAAAQIGVQVGNEQNIRHIRVTQALDGIDNPTAAAMGSARRLGGDIALRAQDRVERIKWRLVPLQKGAAGVDRMLTAARTHAVDQVMSMGAGKVDRAAAKKFVNALSENELSLLDFQHYGRVVGDLVAARAAAITIGGMDQLDRITFIGPRQLTRPVLNDLNKAVNKNQMTLVRGMIEKFDDLYRVYDLEQSDDLLRKQLKDTVDQLVETAPQPLTDVAQLPQPLREWLAKYDALGYHLGLRPEDEALMRPIIDKSGRIVGVNPWVDLIDEKTARQSITRLKVIQRGLFNNISGTSVVRDAQHRFIRLGAERYGLPETALEGLFSKVMRTASDSETTTRGLSHTEMYRAALDTKLPKGMRNRMTARDFAELVLEAHEGSLSKVGLTQKFTGKIKTNAMRISGNNFIGQLAERIYPLTRFKINPFFQYQELIETPFFMLLRGRIPMEDFLRVWSPAGRRAIGDEIDRTLWAMGLVERKGSFYAGDMAEHSLLTIHGHRAINESLQRSGVIARMGRLAPNVHRMKEWGVARSFQYEQARSVARAMREASPESWRNYSEWLAYRAGHRNDRDAVTSYLYDTVAKSDPDSTYAQFGIHAFKPQHMGAQARISTGLLRGLVYGENEGKHIKWGTLLNEIADGKRSATEISEALTKLGADPTYIQRAVDLVTFPKPDAFWKEFARLGRSAEEITALRESAQLTARLKGISEHEYLSRMYAAAPASLSHLGEVQSRTMFQAIADSFSVRGREVVERTDPRIAELAVRGEAHMPDMRLRDDWESVAVKDLTPAEAKARTYVMARRAREANPELGLPPSLTDASRGVTPEQGAAIQRAYDEGNIELGQRLQREAMDAPGAIPGFGVPPTPTVPAKFVAPTRHGEVIHRFGPVQGDEWFDMLSSVMDDATLREKADWYVDMQRSFLALADNDPEEAARLITLFGVSQVNTSPVLGMQFIQRALAAHRRGERLPIDQTFSGLNSAAIKGLLEEGALSEAGIGQKLLDFIDGLLGKRTRTAGVHGPDELSPWMPAAADIWAKRDLGFLDAQMAGHIGRLYDGKAVWEEGVGFHVTTGTGETFTIPASKVTGGSPSDLEYDHIVEFYNDRAREANARNFLDRSDWTAAEMQALGWFRAKFAMGDRTGSPLDAFHQNVHSAYWEAAPNPSAPFSEVFPGADFRGRGMFDPIVGERGVPAARQVADDYMRSIGREITPRRNYKVDPDFGLRTARAYDALPALKTATESTGPVTSASLAKVSTKLKPAAADLDPEVVAAYQAFVDETAAQADAIRAAGVRFEPTFEDPYPNSAAMMADVAENGRLKVFAGSAEHPLMTDDQNVLFRGVHDYFAHASEGNQFGPRGELNAAIKHSQMYSPEARRAMLTETHGQNSFVNFSDKVAAGGQTVADINKAKPGSIYAEQKAALLPADILDEFHANYTGTTPQGIPLEPLKGITKDVAAYVEMEAKRLIGVDTISRYDGIGAWNGATNPNAVFEVLGSQKDAAAFARVIGYLGHQEGVPISRKSALRANAAEGRLHAVDWAPPDGAPGATYAEAEDALKELSQTSSLAREGASIVRYDDGSYGVRSIWMGHTTEQGTIPMAEFKAAHPNATLGSSGDFQPNRVVVETSYHENDYKQFPNGEGHLNWLRENGYGKVADELAGAGRDRAALFYERTYRKHYAGGLDAFRAERALDDDWAERAGPLLDDLDVAYGRSTALDTTASNDLVGRARDAAARGDALFQRHPRGTLGAIAFDAHDNRARIFLNAKRSNPDTLLHELSHQFAEQGLDPSGRKAVLDVYNEEMGRRAARQGARRVGPAPIPDTTWTEAVHEWFAKQMVEWARGGDAPARQLEPIFGYYSKYLKTTTAKAKMSPQVKAILDEITARPVTRMSASNVDEQALFNIMLSGADQSARNARDLIHFRTNRSWIERSLNHPYFGMYPLSYMWGKVLPELAEFLMARPFGMRAPFVAYNTVADIYRAVMLQQENDPKLRKYLADNEPALRAIALMVPGVPWDLPVNTPNWMRRISEAIATQNKRVLDGKHNPDGTPAAVDLTKIDAPRVISDTAGYALNPVKGFGDIVDSVMGVGHAAQLGINQVTGQPIPSSTPDARTQAPPPLTTEQSAPPESPLAVPLAEAASQLQSSLSRGATP